MIVVPGFPERLSQALYCMKHSSDRKNARAGSVSLVAIPASWSNGAATVRRNVAHSATQTPFAASNRSPSHAHPNSRMG